MKLVFGVLALSMLTGCATGTWDTHVKTGCVWSCAEWNERLRKGDLPPEGTANGSAFGGTTIVTSRGNFTVVPNYSTGGVSGVIRSGR